MASQISLVHENQKLVQALTGLLGAMSSSVVRLSGTGSDPKATFADILTADEIAQMDRAAEAIRRNRQ